jgi:Zn-finger nucleic acid-binding protein
MMKCPACSADLLLSERQGIEIDYCPSCRGVWLDRGELDKIIERSASELPRPRSGEYDQGYRKEESHHGHHDDDHDYYIDPKTGKRKRRGGPLGFLGELFD